MLASLMSRASVSRSFGKPSRSWHEQPRDLDVVRGGVVVEVVELAPLRGQGDARHCGRAVYRRWSAGTCSGPRAQPARTGARLDVAAGRVTTCFTIASPRPVPCVVRARSPRKKRSKSRGSSSCGDARPLSATESSTTSPSVRAETVTARAVARVADRVGERFSTSTRSIRGRTATLTSSATSVDELLACRSALGRCAATTSSRIGSDAHVAERDDRATRLELAEEEDVVDELAPSPRPPRAPARSSACVSAPGSVALSSSASSRASGVRSSCETAAVKPTRSSSKAARSPGPARGRRASRRARRPCTAPRAACAPPVRASSRSGRARPRRGPRATRARGGWPRSRGGSWSRTTHDLAALLDERARRAPPRAAERRARPPGRATRNLTGGVTRPITAHPGLSNAACGQGADRRGRRGHRAGDARHLAAAGLEAMVVGEGRAGPRARCATRRRTSCVLDLMLPRRDGWSVIEKARAEGIGTPIIVVSARGTEHDRVHALDIGADDYLVKPFSMAELVARVNAAARRGVRAPERTARRADRDRGAADRPARGAGVRRRRERRADADGVPPALPARARPRPRRHARRAAAEALGPARVAPRPHGRRLRPRLRDKIDRPRRGTRSSRRATASATSSSRCRRAKRLADRGRSPVRYLLFTHSAVAR